MNNDHHRWAPRLGVCTLAFGAAIGLLGACTSIGPKPWDKDLMAKEEMQLNLHPNLIAADEHIYFSREGSSGGRTFDGGGCGCN